MRKAKITLFFTFGFLFISAWLSNFYLFQQPVRSESDLTKNIAAQIGKWNLVATSKPTESEYQGLETTDIIKRTYSDGSSIIHLVVAYIAHSNRKSAHAQEACLRGSGAKVSDLSTKILSKSPVSATIIKINIAGQDALVYYWYKIGSTYTSQYLKSSLLMFLGGLFGQSNQGAALVRISTPIRFQEEEAAAHLRLEDFTSHLTPTLETNLP